MLNVRITDVIQGWFLFYIIRTFITFNAFRNCTYYIHVLDDYVAYRGLLNSGQCGIVSVDLTSQWCNDIIYNYINESTFSVLFNGSHKSSSIRDTGLGSRLFRFLTHQAEDLLAVSYTFFSTVDWLSTMVYRVLLLNPQLK